MEMVFSNKFRLRYFPHSLGDCVPLFADELDQWCSQGLTRDDERQLRLMGNAMLYFIKKKFQGLLPGQSDAYVIRDFTFFDFINPLDVVFRNAKPTFVEYGPYRIKMFKITLFLGYR